MAKVADSRTRARWAWSISWSQKTRKWSNKDGDLPKGHRSQLAGPPAGQIWSILNIKIMILMAYNPLNKMDNHESMRI